MKLMQMILAAAGAASLLPSALADEPALRAKPFTITVSSDVSALAQPELRYPSYAGLRGLEGSCEVSFAVSSAGKADAIRVGACTAEAFRRSAKAVLEAMTFAAAAPMAKATVRWAMAAPLTRTASLE